MRKFVLFILMSFSFSFSETFNQIVEKALKESPTLKIYQYKLKAFDGKIKKAKSPKNPEVEAEFGRLYSQTGDGGLALTSISVNQPLRLWGEKKYAVLSAKLQKQAFKFLYQQKKNDLISDIYFLFYSALANKEKIKLKEEELKNLNQLLAFLKDSYKLGEITPLDVLRVKKDIGIAQIQLEKLKASYKNYLSKLSALVGKPIKDVDGSLYKFRKIKDVDITYIPEVLYNKNLIDAINQEIKRQKALAKPQISVGLKSEEDPVELGKYEFGISFNANLPVFYKREGEIFELVNKKKAIYQRIKKLKLEYTYSLQSTKKQIKTYQRQLIRLEKEVIPSTEEALKLAEKGYKLKTVSFLYFFDIRNQYYRTLNYRINLAKQIHTLYANYIKIGGLK